MTGDIVLYGIANCDTVRKARARLDDHTVEYRFHDYKTAGVDAAALRTWVDRLGWEQILNRSGTTFRKLADGEKADLDATKAIALMLAHPSTVKRPVLVRGETLIVGFDAARYAALA